MSLFMEGGQGGLGKTPLSLSKYVTIKLGRAGSKARVTLSLYMKFFFMMLSLT